MALPSAPQLAAPGAGLPSLELSIARALAAFQRWTGTREGFDEQFEKERGTIRRLVESCEPAQLSRRVLIRRPVGLEDSSRNWSVLMTLDHLRIVHNSMEDIIRKLTSGELPEGTASTAAVKPSEAVTSAVLGEYERSCDTLIETVAAAGDLKTRLRYSHPWFGPMDAAGWHALSATHLGIHRVQIERIVDGLSNAGE
jgi:hypothetical protein